MSIAGTLETVRIAGFNCPKCGERVLTERSGPVACPQCKWSGEAHILRPLKERAFAAQKALPDKAVCANHPSKMAQAVCAGTGDYICALCAVELDGRIYSVDYLNRAGIEKLKKRFTRFLDRPDQAATLYIAGSIFVFFLSPLFMPLALHSFWKAVKLRRENRLYAQVVTRAHVWALGAITIAAAGLYLLLFASLFL